MATISVDVDIDDVLDEISDKELLREIASRKLGDFSPSGRLVEDLKAAVICDDGRRAVDLLAQHFFAKTPFEIETRFAKLERDPATGRPVIQ